MPVIMATSDTVAGLPRAAASDRAVGVYGAGMTQVIAIPLRDREADALRKQAEQIQKQIDLLAVDVKASVTGSRDILLGVYKKNPKKLGDWGYGVDDSPKGKGGPKE